MSSTANTPLSDREGIRAQIRAQLPDPAVPLSDDTHLIEAGLDSLSLMQLIAAWRRAGARVTFPQLMEQPSLGAWWPLLGAVRAEPAPPPAPETDGDPAAPFALTDVQHAYWIGRGDEQVLGGVGCHAYLELDGADIDPARLRRAWRELLARHGMLRARFDAQGRQSIRPAPADDAVEVFDWRGLSADTLTEALAGVREQRSHRRLDVEAGRNAGLALSLLPGGRARLHFDIDLLVADVQSLQILLRDLARLYRGEALPAAPAAWHFGRHLQRTRAGGAGEETARDYWRQRLDSLPSGPALPLRRAPETISRPRFVRRQALLDAGRWRRLRERAATAQVTPAVTLATAYAEVLARWSANPHFLLNLPLFDRHGEALADVVADFTNLLLLEIDADAASSFEQRAHAVQKQLHRDIAHSAYSAVRALRDLAGRVAAPVVFACNLGMPLLTDEAESALGRLGHMISQTPQVWLDHQVYETADGLLLAWDAVDELFPAGMMDAMFSAYVELLERLADQPDSWLHPAVPALPQTQRVVRDAVNASGKPLPPRALHGPVFEQARLRPDAVALIDAASGQSIRFGELALRARRVAALLLRHGLAPGEAVAVTLPRGPEQAAAVLGVQACGGCYVPVGAGQPLARQRRMHARAGIRLTLTDATHLADYPQGLDIADADALPPWDGPLADDPDASAYVIFTSGSTGEPKGVELSHRAAGNTVDDVNRRCGVGPGDRMLAVSALDFDLSVYDLFGVLGAGGALVLVDEASRRDAGRWLDAIVQYGVTLWNSVPMLLDMLLVVAEERARPLPLRLALVSGDWVGLDLPGRLAARAPNARLLALGGATEAAIWSNVCDATAPIPPHWNRVPYGRPLTAQRFRVVDAAGADCPDWVAGELWIGGAGLARGYRGAPELSAERFIEREDGRWYRTGDLGRYWPDGTLEFLGRRDHQIKLRGHRIELGEIEAALLAQPGVRQAAAWVVGEPPALAAAVAGADPAALASALALLLPDHMVPTRWLTLDALPLTANGKVDRRALAAMPPVSAPAAGEPPRPGIEQDMAAIWRDMLRLDAVSRDDGFFVLGGDSLLATKLIARLDAEGWRAPQPLRQLFIRPRLADFCTIWQRGANQKSEASLSPEPDRLHQPFPLTEVQAAYWMGQSEGLPQHCGTGYLIEFDGAGLDLTRLEQAWRLLWRRHPMLSAVVSSDGQQSIPRAEPDTAIIRHAATADLAAARAAIAAVWQERSSARAGQPHAAHAVPYAGGRCRIGVFFDYLTLDGYSIKLLLAQWKQAFQDPASLPPAPRLAFRDFVVQRRPDAEATAEAEQYWRQRLDALPPAPALPMARETAAPSRSRFVRLSARLDAARWGRFRESARRHGLTASSSLLTAYACILARWSGGVAHSLNLTLFDRPAAHPDIPGLVGDFTTLAPVAFLPDAAASFLELARRSQRETADALQYRAVSSIWVQREKARQTGRQAAALPVVFTSTLGLADDFLDGAPPGFPALADGGLSETPQVSLDHQLYESRGELILAWDLVDGLFPAGLMDAMFSAYVELLERLADQPDSWLHPTAPALPQTQRAVRDAVNASGQPLPPRALHGPVFEQARLRPDAVALIDAASGQSIRFGELALRARRVAALLLRDGLAPGEAVAVTLPRGPEQAAAVLGVLACGGCYVPVGAGQPLARQRRMHARAGIRLTLTDATHFADYPQGLDIADADALPPWDGPLADDPDASAYVIFTSGSTGEPKGVELSHRAAGNTVDDVNRRCGVGPDDRMLAVSALDFDLSVYDLFGVLGAGGALVLVDEASRRDAGRWLDAIVQYGVTLWNSVPMLLDMLLVVAKERARPLPLRLALVSGDWVGLDLPGRLAARAPNARLLALGGATEAAIWSNVCDATAPIPPHWNRVPYGRPLTAQRFRVVDAAGADCPDWVAGELWIGGAGLARGYRGAPELSAERFVEREDGRWYRTGDLGRYWPDGTLEFLGRRDHQIKLRGHRIELGEIEAALLAQPGVRQAAAWVVGEPPALAAAVAGADPAALASALALLLPDHMVPTRWLTLNALPLTANGKVDRRALAAMPFGLEPSERRQAPEGAAERELAEIWRQVLACGPVSRDDDFFIVGGDSLRATRLVETLKQRRMVDGSFSLRSLFSAPTLAAQAALLIQAGAPAAATSVYEEGAI